jgi:hypothetical protein
MGEIIIVAGVGASITAIIICKDVTLRRSRGLTKPAVHDSIMERRHRTKDTERIMLIRRSREDHCRRR